MSLEEPSLNPAWTPESWRGKPALQQPAYPDQDALQAALEELRSLPPLVTSWEIAALHAQLADAAAGRKFVLQGGDCAERFSDCTPARITRKLKVLLQMSLVLVTGARKPVVRIGRFGGQYAKPRSEDLETREGQTLPSYRGDLINAPEFTAAARIPDPQRLLRGYERAGLTVNFLRALVKGGFADLHHPEYFDLEWVRHSPQAEEYHRTAAQISEALQFMENILGVRAGDTDRIDFFTAHEALHLGYESAQTRRVPHRPGVFNLSTHFPWLGIRTSQPGGAHVEYLRGIRNPIGVKVGPPTVNDQLMQLMEILDPHNIPGRLTLIHRCGAQKLDEDLPRLINTVRRAGRNVLWICDPMHGNTRTTSTGVKTRNFDEIRDELERSFDIHASLGSQLGGVHIELTGENVTECTGGARGLAEDDLGRAYESEVDPRLNYEQSIELAFLIARKMKTAI